MATITQTGTSQIRENFNEVELRSKSWNAPEQWELSDKVLDVLQFLRSWSGEPIRVTSTLRTPEHNALIPNARPNSFHVQGRAVDFQWADRNVHDTMVKRLRNGLLCIGEHPDGNTWSQMYSLLGNKGGGFGWYETFLHIDDRGGEGQDAVMWDNSNNKYDSFDMDTDFYAANLAQPNLCDAPREGKKKNGLVRVLESIFKRSLNFEEDGIYSYWDRFITYVILIFLGITATMIYKQKKK